MKIAPIMREMKKYSGTFEQILIHTGQHYDSNMSQVFFEELDLPKPDINLEVGSGSHAKQTAEVMMRFEPVLLQYKPDWVLVPGDVNSTLACALVACKLGFNVAHVEAGLRSFDRSMPEEINRLLTDQISDLLFTPSRDGDENLKREGVDPRKIAFVGNVMIDTLVQLLPTAEKRWPKLQKELDLKRYVLVTLHRPSNVDNPATLREILLALQDMAREMKVLFSVHPRTRQRIIENNLLVQKGNLHLMDPLGYLEFLALQAHACLVFTDSGGMQEETTFLGIPCLTVRPNTERPITVTCGTNRLVESRQEKLIEEFHKVIDQQGLSVTSRTKRPEFWDGHTAERIMGVLNHG
jgi:UDP-N-acetylglucosamine 2-epimerase